MVANPYEAPRSRVADVENEDEFQPVKIWSAQGRIGRLRYLAYSTGALLLFSVASVALTGAFGSTVASTLTVIMYIPFLIFCFLVGIQRSHDMNWSGWMTLLSLIPLAGLIWLCKPGTTGLNDYGFPPPPNTTGVKILALIFPVIVILSMAAAIVLPAYMKMQQ